MFVEIRDPNSNKCKSMGSRYIQGALMSPRCKSRGRGRWKAPDFILKPEFVSNCVVVPPLLCSCAVVQVLSKPCSVPVLPCCHGVIALGRVALYDGTVAQCGAMGEVPWLSQLPSTSLSARLAGRNQTFTARAPAAVVLQLINNGTRLWADGEGRDQESPGIH